MNSPEKNICELKELKKNAGDTLYSSYIIQFATKIFSILSQLIIARFFLTTEEYGVFLYVFFIFSIVNNLRDFGISTQIVRRRDINYDLLNSFFLIISLIITAGQIIYGVFIYRQDGMFARSLIIMSLSYIPTAISSAPSIYFLQNLLIKRTVLPRLVSIFGYFIFSVLFSFFQWGPEGLAWAKLIQSVIFTVMIWPPFIKAVKIKFKLTGSFQIVKDSFSFFINDNLGLITAEIYNYVINLYINPAALALYRAAHSLVDIPVKVVEQAFYKVAYPLFSKLVDDKEKLLDSYVALTVLIMVVETPIYAFMFFNDKLLIFLTYGQKYAESAILIKCLAFVPIFTPMTTFGIELIKSLRKDKMMLTYISIGSFFIIFFSFVFTYYYGIVGAALANYFGLNYFIIYYFIYINFKRHFWIVTRYTILIYSASFIPMMIISNFVIKFDFIDFYIEEITKFIKIYSMPLAVKFHDLTLKTDLISSGIIHFAALCVILFVLYISIFKKMKNRVFS